MERKHGKSKILFTESVFSVFISRKSNKEILISQL